MNKNVIIHTESDNNYLCHWKYIRRYKKNGHWVYVYNDKKLSDLRDQQKRNLNKGKRARDDGDYEKQYLRGMDRYIRDTASNPNDPYLYPDLKRAYKGRAHLAEKLKRVIKRKKAVDNSIKETGNEIKERKASKSVALGNKVAELLTSGSEKISKGKEYLKKLVK